MIIRILFLLIIISFSLKAQNDGISEYNFNDTLTVAGVEDGDQPSSTVPYVSSINLTGHIKAMVIVIGFPDRNHNWPKIYNNEHYPKLGAFPDGTLLSDYINTHGPLPVDEWYKTAFEYFFQIHSGGKFTAEAIYVKRSNGEPYLTDNTFQYWINKKGNNENVIYYF